MWAIAHVPVYFMFIRTLSPLPSFYTPLKLLTPRDGLPQHTMPRRGSNADRLLPVASCLLTFALALSLRMFWVLPQDTAPVAAPMKFSAEAYWEDELLVPHPPHPPAQPSAAALTHDRVAWS